ncbi:amidohydrolase family protein [Chloroflexota bacterium]
MSETKMNPLLIRGGHIIDPARGIDGTGSLLILEGKVAWWDREGEDPPHPDYDALPAQGLIVCPGFIDMHCHLREPGFEAKETVATGTAAAAKGGFTTVACMSNTSPPLDSPEGVEYIKAKAEEEGIVRVLPVGCVTRGRKGEELVDLGALAAAGVAGFSDDGNPVATSRLMRQALEISRGLGLPVIDHCEDKSLAEGGQINEGDVSAKLGLKGIPSAAEEIIVARDLALARLTGGVAAYCPCQHPWLGGAYSTG